MLSRQREWTLGLILLGIVVLLWVASSFLVNGIFALYPKPFLMTYINTGAFIFYLVPSCMTRLRKGEYRQAAEVLSVRETIKLAGQFSVLWFLSNLVTNASLLFTSVSSQTILSSTSSFFTLIVGWVLSVEMLNTRKVIAVALSFIGVVLLTKSDDVEVEEPRTRLILMGNILALSGAFFYGVYSILLKLRVQHEQRLNMKLFFGFVGVFSLSFLWPTLYLLDWMGVEKLQLPPKPAVWSVLLVNCAMSFVSDFLWAKAMLLTSPLTVTVGLSASIPCAMLGDVVFKEKKMGLVYVLGAVIILGSFVVVNQDEEVDEVLRE